MATTAQRGYGSNHQKLRGEWAQKVERGMVSCAGCGQPILPGTRWHLGHNHRFGGYAGPEHQRCNIGERNRRHNRKRKLTSRSW